MATTTYVGLDIGSTAIRAVEAGFTNKRPVVGAFGCTALPEGAVVAGSVADPKAVTSALRQLWSAHPFTTRNVILGVTHQQVVVREIDVARLPAREFAQALPHLVRDVLPLPVDEALLDFYPLDHGAGETAHGLVIAVPKAPVLTTVRTVESAGLHVAQVDLACFAALRASALARDTEALIDIGASGTDIIVHTDGTPQIVRSVPRGGNEITAALAGRLQIPTPEAERLKCRVGLRRPTAADTAEDVEAAEIIGEAVRPLVAEIRSSLNYFAGLHPRQRVSNLALVGGAAQLAGLPDRLTAELGTRAFLANPLLRVADDVREGSDHDGLWRERSAAAVSIGLTLGAA